LPQARELAPLAHVPGHEQQDRRQRGERHVLWRVAAPSQQAIASSVKMACTHAGNLACGRRCAQLARGCAPDWARVAGHAGLE
jgi:hypothetical protein